MNAFGPTRCVPPRLSLIHPVNALNPSSVNVCLFRAQCVALRFDRRRLHCLLDAQCLSLPERRRFVKLVYICAFFDRLSAFSAGKKSPPIASHVLPAALFASTFQRLTKTPRYITDRGGVCTKRTATPSASGGQASRLRLFLCPSGLQTYVHEHHIRLRCGACRADSHPCRLQDARRQAPAPLAVTACRLGRSAVPANMFVLASSMHGGLAGLSQRPGALVQSKCSCKLSPTVGSKVFIPLDHPRQKVVSAAIG